MEPLTTKNETKITKIHQYTQIFPYYCNQILNVMSNESIIQLFEGVNIRMVWDEKEQEYYFAVADIVQVYGKYYKTQAATLEGIFRIIQSIPSKKAEPLKQWLAEVGSQRVDQMIDPELTFQMAVADYRRQGYSDQWINERMKSIMTRKALTDEWERVGIKEKQEFAILTNILTKAWSGMTTGQYKAFKGLTKENLRDNMTSVEVALNTLAEASTRELSQQRSPKGFEQSKQTAKDGGGVAKAARDQLEKQLGRSIISPAKASDYLQPIEDVEVKELTENTEK